MLFYLRIQTILIFIPPTLLADLGQKRQRVAERERFKSPLLDLSEEKRQIIRKSILQSVRKQVTQFTLKGEKIETYKSISDTTIEKYVIFNILPHVLHSLYLILPILPAAHANVICSVRCYLCTYILRSCVPEKSSV